MSAILPGPFDTLMRKNLQGDWDAFASAHKHTAPVSIRVNPRKSKPQGPANIPWTDFGYYLDTRPSFTLDPSFHAGTYYVQEASSMFLEQAVSQTVDLSQPLRVLDLCAAPGGKSTHLLSLISQDSLLVSNEVIRPRATTLSENLQKWGHANVVVSSNDPEDFRHLIGFFDLVIVDAPCSGEGLFRKDPRAMDEWSPDSVALCAQRQRRILQDVWPALKKNGVLIYCTCTYNEQENEDNLNWMMQQQHGESIKLKTDDAWGVVSVQKENVIGYRFYPHNLRGEGFFLSAMRKTGEETPAHPKSKFLFANPTRKTCDQLTEWVRNSAHFKFIQQEDLILMIPSSLVTDIAWLSERLRLFNKGTAMATLKHDKLVPEHAAALSVVIQHEFFLNEHLDKERALAYLRKDTLFLGEGKRGFALVVFDNLPIGWVNLLGNRTNNLYPASWRIRMGS